MTTRRVVTALSAAAAFALIGLLAYGLFVAGDTGTLARDIADGKRPRLPTFDLAVLWPPTAERDPSDRALLADGRVQTEELLGTPTLINIWASWCVPCRKEAPELARYSRTRDSATLVGVDTSDTESAARAFIHRYHWHFTNITDNDGSLASDYRIPGLPTTIIVDSHNRVAALLAGPQPVATLHAAASSIANSQ